MLKARRRSQRKKVSFLWSRNRREGEPLAHARECHPLSRRAGEGWGEGKARGKERGTLYNSRTVPSPLIPLPSDGRGKPVVPPKQDSEVPWFLGSNVRNQLAREITAMFTHALERKPLRT